MPKIANLMVIFIVGILIGVSVGFLTFSEDEDDDDDNDNGSTETDAQDAWVDQLSLDLLSDTTDTNLYIPYTYDDEHFARDLEDNFEAKGYNVTFIIILESPTTTDIEWELWLKIQYNQTFWVLVNPQTDAILLTGFDGDHDGMVSTIQDPTISDVHASMRTLLDTGVGNDGKFLIFEFEDYETVGLVNTSVEDQEEDFWNDLEEDDTDQEEYVADTHDCDDFCDDLEDALEAKGYRVTIKLVWWKDDEGMHGHAIVNVHLDDKIITIEPQTDEDVGDQYDDDGDGTVDTESPGSVRARLWLAGFELCLDWGTDGKYVIFEYEDMEDIPIPVD